jgi:hypothetical protein
MAEQHKTLKELREEMGLGLGQLDDAMQVPPGTTHKLEALGVTYPDILVVEDDVWVVPYSETFGEWKDFWFVPEEAVEKWREAVRVLEGMWGVADALDNLALRTALEEAKAKCREELAGSIELLGKFRRRDESFLLKQY